MLNIDKVVNDWYQLKSVIRCYEDATLDKLMYNFNGFDENDRSFYFTQDDITYKIIKWNDSDSAFLSNEVYINNLTLDIHTLEHLQELNTRPSNNLFL